MASTHNATHNEGGYGYNPYDAAELAKAKAVVETRIQHIIDNATAYRAAWAAAWSKYSNGGQLASMDLQKVEAEAGVTLAEIAIVKARMAKA